MAVGLTPLLPRSGRGSAIQVLVRMKLAMMRHSLRNANVAGWTYTGGAIGLVLACATIAASLRDANLLSIALALWMLGWIVGPLFTGGGDEMLRPEYFTSIGLPDRKLASALLAGSLISVGAVISLVALLGLVAVGVQAGPAATAVAVFAVVTQLVMFVATSKLAVALYGLLLRLRTGAILAGVVSAFILAFISQGWALIAVVVSGDMGGTLGVAAGLIPSGWGLLAVQAAGRGDWVLVAGALLGSLLLSGIAFWGWSALLARRTVEARFRVRPRRLLQAHDPWGAALGKERRSLTRELLYSNRLAFAVCYGLSFCLMPVAVGWTGMVPWAGPLFVVMAAATAANMYGSDGTALWMMLAAPRAEVLDVRARQLTFLTVVAPLAVLITLAMTPLADQPGQWPYVTASLPALLGGAAGLTLYMSVYAAVPTLDPHKRSGNPLAIGGENESAGLMFLAMLALILLAAPALLAARLWGWWGVGVGVSTGVLWWWWMGRLAIRRLGTHGVELLTLLRHGRSGRRTGGPGASPLEALPARQRRLAMVCLALGAIPLLPQGVVPTIFLLSDTRTTAWFLAMFAPPPWSWLIASGMILLGLAMYGYAGVQYRQGKRLQAGQG